MDLADVQDLAKALKNRIRIQSVVSFESDVRFADQARDSAVASILQVAGVEVNVIPNSFPEGLETTTRPRGCARIFFFLIIPRHTNPRMRTTLPICWIAKRWLTGDWLIITSALDPGYVNTPEFVKIHRRRCEMFFQTPNVGYRFVQRNFVDALIKLAADNYCTRKPTSNHLSANLVSKFTYSDGTPIGVWVFRIEMRSQRDAIYLVDKPWIRIVTN